MQKLGIIRSLPSLISKHSIYCPGIFNLGNSCKKNFNIFWTASNRSFEQKLSYRKIDDMAN